MAFQFPWTNLHELNLDWFLSKFKQFTNNYLGTTATVELIPTTEQPEVTVTGGTLDDDTDIVDPFTFNFKLPINTSGGAVDSVNGMVGDVVIDKNDIGLSNVDNVQQYSATNPPPYPVTSVNGMTGDVIVQGANGNYAPAIISSASGAIAHFTDGADNIPINDLTIGIVPAQSGSGTPSPSNIRPITGWTGANVAWAKKNLLDDSIRTFSGNNIYFADSITGTSLTLPAGTYTISFVTADGTITNIYMRNVDTNAYISGFPAYSATSKTFTLTTETAIRVWAYKADYTSVNDIKTAQIEAGATVTPYESYTAPTITAISWQNEVGTVYGGSLDVTTGVLTVTDGYIASYNGETLPSTWISDRDVYAEGTTPTTGAQVVYKLSTPQSYQITPHQFITLFGVNNIWCDTGDTTIEYTADTKEFIQNLTQPTEDDMTANTSIASGKFFMISNNLYKATTAIASGSQIIPGTNATPMSLADALNLL